MVKILALGDPHGKLPKNLSSVVKKRKIGLIICVGDIPLTPKNPGEKKSWIGFRRKANKSYGEMIKKLCSYKIPVLTLRGNMYFSGRGGRISRRIFNKYKNLYHKRTGQLQIDNVTFVFFDMSWEKSTLWFSKRKMSKKRLATVQSRKKRLNKILKGSKDSVVISHAPPFSVLDKTYFGKNAGSRVLLEAIKKHQPKLVLCGHIHEAKGEKKIGKTKVINLGIHGYKVLEI